MALSILLAGRLRFWRLNIKFQYTTRIFNSQLKYMFKNIIYIRLID